ncbi:MAG: hypothetical protein V1664_00715 [Candidatus Uhrbacteria bacterium]
MESDFRDLAVKSWNFLRNGLFPVYCLNCQKEGQKICADCASFVLEKSLLVCPFCHTENEEGETCKLCADKTFLDGSAALGFYHQPILRQLIQSWKFNGEPMAEKILLKFISEQKPQFILPPIDWYVTAIPLHAARQRERGFNQAEIIARAVAKGIDSEYLDLLERVEWTDPQAGRSSDERLVGDLDGIFSTTGLIPPHVLICDDVLTSGATMDAAAQTLKIAGAEVVWGFTLARAGS